MYLIVQQLIKKMPKLYRWILTMSLFIWHLTCFSQTRDFESWIDFGIGKKLNDKLSLGFEESLRLNQNACHINSLNSDLVLEYKINQSFEVGGGYRISMKNQPNGYFAKHRGNIDVTYKNEINQFKISFRNRTQVEKDYYIENQKDIYPQFENRNRIKLFYNIRGLRTDPFLALELFHQISSHNFYKINAYRIYSGVGRRFPGDLKLNLAFIYERAKKKIIENTYILNISIAKEF